MLGIFYFLNTSNMSSLEHIRHSLAHALAAAIMENYPHAKRTIGPAIDTGFYFDFDFSGGTAPTEKDFPALEKRMRHLLKTWQKFEREEVTAEEAKKRFDGNQYKTELIEEFSQEGQSLTFYKSGAYEDLCRGGHVDNPSSDIDPGSFCLDKIAGAYWRGSEKNAMLTRIYGLAFETKEALDAYKTQRDEAKKRDHRKLGAELDLFLTSELVGAGLPLWTPRGTTIRFELDRYVWELRAKHGYQRVTIPHITKKELYETSGHWAKFADELFRITTREGKEYALKPMNCPHHTQIFARKPFSYREMPQRYAESTMVYRDEQSGELGGLTRVLSITQDDSHVFCRHSQVREEYFKIWDIVDNFYGTFGFSNMRVRLSFHDPAEFEKYLGTKEIWKNAEDALRSIAQERNADFFEAPGEAAMYGPKLDFMAKDSMGREHQVATIQLDMNLPERFDLTCINEKGEKERIVMIHCAIMGSFERFGAVLIEHVGGNFPTWLSPVQAIIIPVAEAHAAYAQEAAERMRARGMRAEVSPADDSLGKRIRAAKMTKVPYIMVVGEKEIASSSVSVESRDQGPLGSHALPACIDALATEISTRAQKSTLQNAVSA
ncbi:MAG: threonine--tRNA ligase [Candidatus Pacebacteria bacterium]|nr:threonine--tRNA ligase [Candidatus Paceibacterota bacterium]